MAEKKTCPQRLVEYFNGLELAAEALRPYAKRVNPRVQTLPKQTIHSWVVAGFIPEIYAAGVETVTKGEITALEVLDEANRARRLLSA